MCADLHSKRVHGTHCPGTDDDGKAIEPSRATCGTCGRSWCFRCHPTPASLCPFCNGDEAAGARAELPSIDAALLDAKYREQAVPAWASTPLPRARGIRYRVIEQGAGGERQVRFVNAPDMASGCQLAEATRASFDCRIISIEESGVNDA